MFSHRQSQVLSVILSTVGIFDTKTPAQTPRRTLALTVLLAVGLPVVLSTPSTLSFLSTFQLMND
jgi:hypothetical protein